MFSFFNKGITNSNMTIYDYEIKSISGDNIKLSKFKGKILLLVNVASNCGFTKQYSDLQNLYDTYKEKGFVVLGIPSNQFGGQEPGNEKEIKDFCETNFNITFHPIYSWAKETYGNSAIPKWNFHKILINKDGIVQNTYSSFTNPTSSKILKEIEKIIN